MSLLDSFLELADPRLGDLQLEMPRSARRMAQLVLQAMFREGMLAECERDIRAEEVTLRRGESELKVKGWVAGNDDRFFLSELDFTLPEFMERVRVLAGLERTESWTRLEDEVLRGQEIQAVAYRIARSRPEPRDYFDFESWTPEGHNLHPGAKTRDGFSAADQMAYSPDMTSTVELPWLAVKKSLLQASGEIAPEFELDEDNWAVPIHPWQLERVLPSLYAREMDSFSIRSLDRDPVVCRLCTSLRTVVPQLESLPVLKTSVGCLMTSTERSMSRYTVLQGPVYSEYLRRIFAAEPSFARRITALDETGGFCWSEDGDAPRSRNLSLLFRQRPPELSEGTAVPCSTLPQPVWNDPARTYFHAFFGQGAGPYRNFQRYADLILPFHLELYLRHGLALEAHLQNCVVVWTERGPERLWVRDWGGLRADAQRLSELAPDVLARLDRRSVSLSDAQTAEKKLIACLYCNHMTEVVAGVSRAFEIPEADLWAEVARVSGRVLEPYGQSSLTRAILNDDWPVKCLLRMRLAGSGDLYRHRSNPLQQHLKLHSL